MYTIKVILKKIHSLRGRDTIDFFEKKLNFTFFFNVKL